MTEAISTQPPSQNILILLTGKAVTDPTFVEKVTAKFQNHDTNTVHRQVLDRVASGAAKLEDSSFTKIVYIPSSAEEQDVIFTTPKVLQTLHKALAPKGVLTTISLSSSTSENSDAIVTPSMITKAIISGFLQTKDKTGFEKSDVSFGGASAATIVRRPKASTTNGSAAAVKIPIFKRQEPASTTAQKRPADKISSGVVKLSLDDDLDEDESDFGNGLLSADGDDDLVDENDLLNGGSTHIELSKPIVLPAKCDPGPGKRRRKACKDCTCGLRELELQEEEAQRNKQNAVILNLDDEIDFTVPGTPVGSCGSCALGDAFRCDGCPYLGLPPFKPGEIINIAAIKNDS